MEDVSVLLFALNLLMLKSPPLVLCMCICILLPCTLTHSELEQQPLQHLVLTGQSECGAFSEETVLPVSHL